MEEYLRLYNLYHRIFMICLIGACIFLIISIIMFFRFKVWVIIGGLTGKTAKNTIAKMEEEYRHTGKLTPLVDGGETTTMLPPPETEITELMHVINNHFMIEKQIILIHTDEVI